MESVDEKTILISVMRVNNETGAIMPVSEIRRIKSENAVVHTDAVQAFGKMPLNSANADIVTVSAHKIHGPKGCGAIAVKSNVRVNPVIFGGGQEKNLRSGTENVAAIAGFGAAADMAYKNLNKRYQAMESARRYILEGVKAEVKDIKINSLEETSLEGESGFGSPSILNISFLGTKGEVILHSLESEGIFVSTGAACSSNKRRKSYVLAAMGLTDKEIESALRFSFCEFNTICEMDYVLCKLKDKVNKFRTLGSLR
jgi:cysteine desulfurase